MMDARGFTAYCRILTNVNFLIWAGWLALAGLLWRQFRSIFTRAVAVRAGWKLDVASIHVN